MKTLTTAQLAHVQGGNIANMFGFLPDLIRYVQQTGMVQAYCSSIGDSFNAAYGTTPNASQYNAMGDYSN
jgi:bacteriocin-like protein